MSAKSNTAHAGPPQSTKTTRASKRSAFMRYGGDRGWQLPDGRYLCMGEANTFNGHEMQPWDLEHYERAMKLHFTAGRILRALTRHVWEYGGEAYISLHRLERTCNITRPTLRKHLKDLEALGLIRKTGTIAENDDRVRYCVSGAWAALAACIGADPKSKWSKVKGGPVPRSVVESMTHSWPFDGAETRINIDFGALYGLADASIAAAEDEGEAIAVENWPMPQTAKK